MGKPRIPTRSLKWLALGLLFIALIGFIDYITGLELSFGIFYLVPILLLTWNAGRGVGIAASILSAITWFAAELLQGRQYSTSLILYWNAVTRLGFFVIVAFLLPAFKTTLQQERKARESAEVQVERQLKQLRTLHSIDMAINASLDLRVTLDVILDRITDQLAVDAVDILLLDPHTQMLQYAAGRGFRTGAIKQSEVRLGEGYAGRAALERRALSIPRLAGVKDFHRSHLLEGEDFASYYCVPLIGKGQVKGVIDVFQRRTLELSPERIEFLESIAAQTAIAVDNAQLLENLQKANVELSLAYDTTLAGWVQMLDLRDRETEGHTERVTEMTVRFARALRVPEQELVHVRRGALLHDIGKMAISDSILAKERPLAQEEWAIVQKHTIYAYEILRPIRYLQPALDIPYCHHERWDGKGYPRGLEGEQIPLAARIFAVVDAYDAMTRDRPFRKAMPRREALEELREGAGTQFDPKIVAKFIEMFGGV